MLEQYPNDFLNVKEVAQVLGSDVDTVRYWLRNGKMPGKRIGERWYVAKEWLCQPSNQGKEHV